jgi:tRNA threonylcarbamoyladenosine modification (KEOPS) complex  Pcc1 subunit
MEFDEILQVIMNDDDNKTDNKEEDISFESAISEWIDESVAMESIMNELTSVFYSNYKRKITEEINKIKTAVKEKDKKKLKTLIPPTLTLIHKAIKAVENIDESTGANVAGKVGSAATRAATLGIGAATVGASLVGVAPMAAIGATASLVHHGLVMKKLNDRGVYLNSKGGGSEQKAFALEWLVNKEDYIKKIDNLIKKL